MADTFVGRVSRAADDGRGGGVRYPDGSVEEEDGDEE